MCNKKQDIKVSICCITFNQEDYIKDALDSFLMQKTNFKYEIIIHDDASTDNTVRILKEYKQKYPDMIKLILQKNNQYSLGKDVLSNTFNIANGKYIAICEGDDYWTDENKLQIQVDYMESNENCTLCTHSFNYVDKNRSIINSINRYKHNTRCSERDIILGDGNFFATASLMIPTKILKDLPDYYYNCTVGDYPIQLHAMSKGYAYYISKNMSDYRLNSNGSWTSNLYSGTKDEVKVKCIEHNKDMINMLESFNKSTDYKYRDIVNEMINRFEIDIYLQNEDYSILKQKRSRQYIKEKELSKKTKLIFLLRAYLPYIADKMKLIKDYIVGV